jgi:hypothetical protein
MKPRERTLPGWVLTVLSALICVGCNQAASPGLSATPKPEQELAITFGGFVQNGPEDERLDGVCGTDATRNVVNCDIHNGLMDWDITEVTFQIVRDGDDSQHYYRERLQIAPLQTGHATMRLGMQIAPDDQLKVRGRAVGPPTSHWS